MPKVILSHFHKQDEKLKHQLVQVNHVIGTPEEKAYEYDVFRNLTFSEIELTQPITHKPYPFGSLILNKSMGSSSQLHFDHFYIEIKNRFRSFQTNPMADAWWVEPISEHPNENPRSQKHNVLGRLQKIKKKNF